MKKILAMLLCVLMLVSVMSACAKDPADDGAGDDDGNEGTQADDVLGEDGGLGSTEQSEGKPEGWTPADATESIHVTLTAAIITLEPWAASGNQSGGMVKDCYTSTAIWKSEEGEYMGGLFESWKMAEDSMSVEFTIRDNVYWHSGEKFDVDDAIFTFEDIRDNSRYPDSFAKNWRNYIGTVEKIDDKTIKLNFSQIMPEFWGQITGLSFINEDLYNEIGADAYWAKPDGTGPYVIKEWDNANTKVVLEMRSDEHGYWGYDVFEDKWTNVKTITMEFMPEAQTRLAALRTGETDIIDIVPTTDVADLISEGFTVERCMSTTERFMQFACGEDDVFYDKNLREAFSLCLDRQLLCDTIMNGFATAIEWPAREGEYGYQADPPAKYEYNLERAKELVEASDYNGEKLKLIATVTYVPEAGELAVAIQSMAAEAGFDIEVVTCEAAIYDEYRMARDFDLCLANIGGGTDNWYKTANNVIGNDRFNSGTTTQALIEPALELGTTVDPERLQELYTEVWTQLLTTFDSLTLIYWPVDCAAYNPRITNVKHRYSNYVYVSEIVVKEEA